MTHDDISKEPKSRARFAIVIAAVALLMNVAHAEWEVVPEIGLTAATTNNPRMIPGNDDDAPNSALSLQATASSGNERGEFYVRPRFVTSAYSDADDADLESEDYFLRSYGEYRWRTSSIGFDFDYSQELIIDSEIFETIPLDPDIQDPDTPETGKLLAQDDERRRFVIVPYFEIDPSERSRLRLGARHIDTDYRNRSVSNFGRTDYRESMIDTTYAREMSERSEFSGRIYYSEYATEGDINTTDSTGIEAVFDHDLSEIWNMGVTIGAVDHDIRIDPATGPISRQSESTMKLDFALRKRTELTTLNLNLGQNVLPTGDGNLMERNELYVYASQRLSMRLTFFGGLRLGDIEPIGGNDPLDAREYARIETGLEWRMARKLYLRGSYGYTLERFPIALIQDAESNELALSFAFRGLSSP